MSANHDHLTQAHRARSAADALEREIIPSSGDRQTDIEIAAARVVAVMRLRECTAEADPDQPDLPVFDQTSAGEHVEAEQEEMLA